MRRGVLPLLFFGVLMGALDIAIVGPALPALRAAFGVDERRLSWVFGAFVLCNLVATPLWAKLSDRLGRRSIYTVDVALFGVGSLIVALAPSYAVLILGRALQGIGAGGIFPVASAVIGDTFPIERRGRALGLIGAVFGLAFLIGPALGGVLLLAGWRYLFVVNLPIAAVLIVASLRLLPGAPSATRAPLDLLGVSLLGGLLAAFTLAVSGIDSHALGSSLTSLRTLGLLGGALLLALAFLLVERRAVDPILRPALLRRRQVALTMAFAFGGGLGESASVFLPAYLVTVFALEESTASFMLLPIVVAMGIGSPLAGRLLDRVGARPVVFAGLGLLTAGLTLFAIVGPRIAVFYAGGVLAGLGLASLLGAPLRYILLAEAGPEERAAAQGLLTLCMGIGQLVGAALVGGIVASQGGGIAGYHLAFVVLAAVTGLLALLALLLRRRSRGGAPAAG